MEKNFVEWQEVGKNKNKKMLKWKNVCHARWNLLFVVAR
jgi:hypothetical protein